MKLICLLLLSLKLCSCLPTSEEALIEKANFEILKDTRTYGDDGSYSFNYETSNGIKRSESAVIKEIGGPVVSQGAISYRMPNGKMFHLTFIADENGYRPQSNMLPVAPAFPHPIPSFVQRQIEKAKLEDEAREQKAKTEKMEKSSQVAKSLQETSGDVSESTAEANHNKEEDKNPAIDNTLKRPVSKKIEIEIEKSNSVATPADTKRIMKDFPKNDSEIKSATKTKNEVSKGKENMSQSKGLNNELKGKTAVKLLIIGDKMMKMNEVDGSSSAAKEVEMPEAEGEGKAEEAEEVEEGTSKTGKNVKAKEKKSKRDV